MPCLALSQGLANVGVIRQFDETPPLFFPGNLSAIHSNSEYMFCFCGSSFPDTSTHAFNL